MFRSRALSALTVIALLCLPGLVWSRFCGARAGCFSGGYYQGSYYPSAYQSYNYYQPASYSYTPVVQQEYYQEPVQQKVIAQNVAVAPLYVTVPIESAAVPVYAYGASHYYSVQESYQQKAAIREIIREELKAYLAQGQSAAQTTTTVTVQPSQPAQAAAPAQPAQPDVVAQGGQPAQPAQPSYIKQPGQQQPTDLGPDTTYPPEQAKAVLAAFQAGRCVQCHGKGNSLKGGLRLVYDRSKGNTEDYQLAMQPWERRWVVYGQASTGVMPPEAKKDPNKAMPQQHLPALLRWVLTANPPQS